LTSTLDGGEWSASCLAESRGHPTAQEPGWTPKRSECLEKRETALPRIEPQFPSRLVCSLRHFNKRQLTLIHFSGSYKF